jgi:SRSO17 transposase
VADEHGYYPVEVAPYTPAHHVAHGKHDPAVRTKPQIALQFVQQAGAATLPCRAVVADCLYGEHDAFTPGLRDAGVGYVHARQLSHAWWHPADEPGT